MVREEVRPGEQADPKDRDRGLGPEADDRALALSGNRRHPGRSGAEDPVDLRRNERERTGRRDNQAGVSSSLCRRVRNKGPTVRWGAHKSFQDRQRANKALGDRPKESRHG